VIDLQVTKYRDAIIVNAGVLDIAVHNILWDFETPEFVEQPECTVGARVGQLINGRDQWWPLTDSNAAEDVARKVVAYVLPFLEHMQTREAMLQWLEREAMTRRFPLSIITAAILASLLGETSKGCETLANLQNRSVGDWSARAVEVAKRLKCGPR